MLKKFISYYKPHIALFLLDIFCALAVSVCDLVYPMLTRSIMNEYLPNNLIKPVIAVSVLLAAVYLVKMVLNYIINYYGHIVGVRIQADMRRDIFIKLQKLPYAYFDKNKTGSLMSRIVNDLMDISELAHHGPEDLFISLIMLIGSFVLMLFINLPITLILFAFLPALIFVTIKMRRSMTEAFTATRETLAEINAGIENSIAGVRVVKAFTNDAEELNKFDKNNEQFKVARAKAYKKMAQYNSVMNFSVDIMNVIVIALGGMYVLWGKISLGDFTAYALFVAQFLTPIKRMIAFVEQYQSGMSGFIRFNEIMNAEEEQESENACDIVRAEGDIRFCNVSFTYEDDGSAVLNNINLHIPKGTTMALVGPSGGGKTTLCSLIPRFYDITSGEITLDGKNIKDIKIASLRENIGVVSQDTFLFAGTIKENIAYGKPNATDDEIIKAAKNANIYEFICELPEGFNTYVGERGVRLSGGQKQRISIARVFLKNPPILILDEATSALDNATELYVQKSIEALCQNRTTLIVAHRLSTIKNADVIVVLSDEGIGETGTHQELLGKNGAYTQLYNAQIMR